MTRTLLASGETEWVDYKKIPGGVSADDLVAFANSGGGQLLIGVVETEKNGAQAGMVVGCDVSDSAVLQILNRASSCIPPVSVDIYIENLGREPIFRILVPASSTKPHCTPKGVYCRRDGTRTRALHPAEMLNIFLDIEAQAFAKKFEYAANKIADDLTSLEESLDASIGRMADQLGWADYQLGDTESKISAILSLSARIDDRTNDINQRMRSLFRQDGRDDPVKIFEAEKLVEQLVEQIYEDPDLRKGVVRGQELSFTAKGKPAVELSEDELRMAMVEAGKVVRRRFDRERYSSDIKKPKDCSKDEIDRFVALVSRGGEVSDGIEGRIIKAQALGFVKYDKYPVGVAAIKRPLKAYREKVFEKSGSELNKDDFLLELGWVYLKENHRNKGLMTPLIEEMLSSVDGRAIFATTRNSNVVMIQLLEHFGFKQSGSCYRSVKHPDETLRLYVKAE